MEATQRGFPIAPPIKEQAQNTSDWLRKPEGLGDNVVEEVCCVCDRIVTNPDKIQKKPFRPPPQTQESDPSFSRPESSSLPLPHLYAWRSVLHHVHSDTSWQSIPQNLDALHEQYDLSRISSLFAGLYLSPRGVEFQPNDGIYLFTLCTSCHRSLVRTNGTIINAFSREGTPLPDLESIDGPCALDLAHRLKLQPPKHSLANHNVIGLLSLEGEQTSMAEREAVTPISTRMFIGRVHHQGGGGGRHQGRCTLQSHAVSFASDPQEMVVHSVLPLQPNQVRERVSAVFVGELSLEERIRRAKRYQLRPHKIVKLFQELKGKSSAYANVVGLNTTTNSGGGVGGEEEENSQLLEGDDEESIRKYFHLEEDLTPLNEVNMGEELIDDLVSSSTRNSNQQDG